MKLNFLEEIGGVKTARREAESLLLATALLRSHRITVRDEGRMLKLAMKNKVLLRAADLIHLPSSVIDEAKKDVDEAFDLYDRMSGVFTKHEISFVAIKSFDSLPDIGHDIDLLVASPSELAEAEKILVNEYRVRPQGLTHCDRLLGKFSCFLPGYKHDFELYPTISQLGEIHLEPDNILRDRKIEKIEGRNVWVTSDLDRVLIRIIHAMFRHNFLKLSDVIDFEALTRNCTTQEILDAVEKADIGDAFLFFVGAIDRFLKAGGVESVLIQDLKHAGQKRFGKDRLRVLRRDRLVLPYRIPTLAIILIFLIKGAREASKGGWRSSLG